MSGWIIKEQVRAVKDKEEIIITFKVLFISGAVHKCKLFIEGYNIPIMDSPSFERVKNRFYQCIGRFFMDGYKLERISKEK